jgi:hypothetical protein
VICFPWGENVPDGQIQQQTYAQYGDSAVSCRVVYERIEMFKSGHTSVTDAECLGHPTTATTAQNEERARELILENRRVTVDKIVKQLNIIIGSACFVVHDNFQFHTVCAKWVPKELTDEHKHMSLDICSFHLTRYCEDDNFLQRIITGDETWVHHYQPGTKRKNMCLKHPSAPVVKKFKTTIGRQVDVDNLLGFSRASS